MKAYCKFLAVFAALILSAIPLFYGSFSANGEVATEFLNDELLTDIPPIPAAATVDTALNIKAKSYCLMEPKTGIQKGDNTTARTMAIIMFVESSFFSD